MQYWGKIIGIMIGIMSGTDILGAIIGFMIGHAYDLVSEQNKLHQIANSSKTCFLVCTFQILGYLTKAKGRVTEGDIQRITKLMDRMQLHDHARMLAQNSFNEGTKHHFPLRETVRKLRRSCRCDFIHRFMVIQIQAAFADGTLHPNEKNILFIIADELCIAHKQLESLLKMMEASSRFEYNHSDYFHRDNAYQPVVDKGARLADACKVLGVQPNDEKTTIKRAYRKLMGEHHPDKLASKGLPPQQMERAKQQAQSIQAAYDYIKKELEFK